MTTSKPLKLTRPEPTEAEVLASIIVYLTAQQRLGRVVWFSRMNTGAGKLQYGNGTSQFMRFGFKGCPDILGQLPCGRLLAVEVKRPSGRVSEDQASFISKAANSGAVAFVARSVDDVARVMA
jgi:hypothetical protein